MKLRKKDIAMRIEALCLEIKHLVEDHDISKRVIIEDFTDIITAELVEE